MLGVDSGSAAYALGEMLCGVNGGDGLGTAASGEPRRGPAGWRGPATALMVAAAYAVGAGCSWVLFHAATTAVFFPPAGVTLAALVLTTRRRWGWVLAAAAVTEFGIDGWQGQSLAVAAGFAAANTVEPLLGAALLRWRRPTGVDLTRWADVAWFLTCGVIVGPLAGAVIGSVTIGWGLQRSGWGSFGPWWAGDALAVLTLATAITAYGNAGWAAAGRRIGRAAPALLLTAALTVVGFWPLEVPLSYLPLPMLVVAALAGQIGTVAAAGFVMAFTANVVSGAGHGPWAALASRPLPEAASLQVYLAVAALTGWALVIGIAERDRARLRTQRAVAVSRRLGALQELTAGLATAATSRQIGEQLAQHGFGVIADYGVVTLLDADSSRWLMFGSTGLPPKVAAELAEPTEPPGQAPRDPLAGPARAADRAELLRGPDELLAGLARIGPGLVEAGTQTAWSVPVRAGGRRRGTLVFAFADAQAVDAEVMSVCDTIAGLAGQAVERASLYEAEHRTAHQLQQALLPRIPLDLPGVHAGASYRPAQAGHDVGGDWYDVFELPGNRVGFAVGDVVGHDLRAAIVMGQLQILLRSVALTGANPAEVLDAMDQACGRIDGAFCCTVGYGEYNPGALTLRYGSAGHPPWLVLVNGEASFLEEGRSLPLGVAAGARTYAEIDVPAGAALVCYSDGLIERRGEDLYAGMTRLADLTRQLSGADPQHDADALLAAMTGGRAVEDDVVVACLHLHGTMATDASSAVLRYTLRQPSELSHARKLLRGWAGEQRLSPAQSDALILVCSEAVADALQHAQPACGLTAVELNVARADANRIRVEVSDGGRWRLPTHDSDDTQPANRGLAVISRLAHRAAVELRHDGTRVTAILPVD